MWNPYTKRNIDKIEMVQRRAARFVYNDYSRYSHVSSMISDLEWDTLEQRRLLTQTCMFFKIHQGFININFPSEVQPLARKSRCPNQRPYRQISCNNNIFKFSFYPRTIVTWNKLSFNSLPSSTDAFKLEALPMIRSLV